MITSDAGSSSPRGHQSLFIGLAEWRWLLFAALALPFSNLGATIPVLAWIAPAALLRFVRVNRSGYSLAAAFIVAMLATTYQLRGVVPVPIVVLPAIIGLFAFFFFVPFLLDAWLAPRVGGFGARRRADAGSQPDY